MSAAIKAAKRSTRGSPGAAGDPGLFGGLFGAVKGGLKNVFGGPGAVVMGAAGGFRKGFAGAPTAVAPPVPVPISIAQVPPPVNGRNGGGAVPVVPTPGIAGMAARFFPGGKTGLEVDIGTIPTKGFHLNKSDYFLKDGTFIAKGTRMVKDRRRNPLNPRALMRAVGRIDAGKIWQGKLSEIATAKFTAAGNRKACN